MNSTRTIGSPRLWLGVIAAVYVAFAIGYNLVTPSGPGPQHNPDENNHMQYIQVLAGGHLPVFRAGGPPEYHQPPLYYLLCTPVYVASKSGGDPAAIHWVRGVATLLGLLLIAAMYQVARRIRPDDPVIAVLAAGLVALLPMNVATDASVGNDALVNALVGLGLMLLVETAVGSATVTKTEAPAGGLSKPDVEAGHPSKPGGRRHASQSRSMALRDATPEGGTAPRVRDAALLGVVLGLIILTKTSGLVLFPVVFVAFALLGYRKVLSTVDAVKGGGLSMGLGLLIGAPWMIRNTLLYGDPFVQKLFKESYPNTPHTDVITHFIYHDSLAGYLGGVAKWTFASFWGVFDSMTAFWGRSPHAGNPSLTGPLPPIYGVLVVICLVALAGLILYFRTNRPDPARASLLWSFILLIFATGYGFLMFILEFFQAQGRYYFTALVPLALFFALGLRGLAPARTAFLAVTVAVLVGMAALNVYTIVGLLWPRFH
ncbi:MAG: hypothetical protein ACLQVD_16430 [Capsulimonadaceae bacterium]